MEFCDLGTAILLNVSTEFLLLGFSLFVQATHMPEQKKFSSAVIHAHSLLATPGFEFQQFLIIQASFVCIIYFTNEKVCYGYVG